MYIPAVEPEADEPQSQLDKLTEARAQAVDLIITNIGVLADPRNVHSSNDWRLSTTSLLTPLVNAADFLDREILLEDRRVSLIK